MSFQPRSTDGRFAQKTGSPAEVVLKTEGDWREQTVSVFGRPYPLGNVEGGKLYHGSSRDLPVGTILTPQAERNFKESATDAVSITSDIQVAAYWPQQAGAHESGVYIYEVEPLGEVEAWRVGLANQGHNIRLSEGRVPQARIISKVRG